MTDGEATTAGSWRSRTFEPRGRARHAWTVTVVLLFVMPMVATMTVAASAAPTPTSSTSTTSTTSTTAPTTTTTSSSSTTSTTTSTTTPAAPSLSTIVDSPPLVGVDTMAQEDGKDGVLLNTYRDADGGVALPGCPDTVASDLGDSCFYADPSNGTQWVQVLVLQRTHLSLVSNTDIACPQATAKPQEAAFDNGTTGGTSCTAALSNTIAGLNDGDLVIAVNQPGTKANQAVEPPVGVGAVLGSVGSNHGIGGPATWFNDPDHGAHLPNAVRGTVSVLGVPTWKKGGVALESPQPNQWGSGALDTNIALNNHGVYAPLDSGSSDIETESPITRILDQAPSSWPKATPHQAEAFSAIGVKVDLGPNPRAQYYSVSSSSNNSGAWASVQTKIDRVHYSDFTSPDFTSSDFDWAKNELETEIGYVSDVDNYTSTLAMPYQKAGTSLWSYFNSVQDAVNSSTQNGATAETFATIGEVFASILEVAPVFGEAAHKIAAAIVGAYHLALSLSNVGAAEDEPFSTQAAELASELTTRLNTTAAEIEERWRNIIVADYGKLQTVALCTRHMENSCPKSIDDSEAWHISGEDENTMKQIIELGLQRDLYTTLVPVKYTQAMALNVTTPGRYSRNGGAGGWCEPGTPFAKGTGAYLQPLTGQSGYVQPIVLVNRNGKNPVSQAVLDRMFEPVDKGQDYTKGGLGIDEDDFFNANYHVNKPRNPPLYVEYNYYFKYNLCGWLPK